MARYRSKALVDAVQWDGGIDDAKTVRLALGEHVQIGSDGFIIGCWTAGGNLIPVEMNDWIVRDERGFLSVHKPEVFAALFEAA